MNYRFISAPRLVACALLCGATSLFGANAMPAVADSLELPAQESPEAAWWREAQTKKEERLAWWREARFGMFIHWGVYSALGNEYEGRKGGGYAEHIQRVLKIPIADYRTKVASRFNPTAFDADAWVRAAHDAGMGYLVITSKHHDGFAMWPSQVSHYNVMEATPWHHDPLADLRAACRKYGVKFGLYYSHAFDWGEAEGPGNDWDYANPGGDKKIGGVDWWKTTPEFLPHARHYVDTKAIPQLQELVRRYDPDLFWFDTPAKLPPSENYRVLKAVRAASDHVVINGRLVRGWGDYESTADRPANFPPHAGDWEGIPTTNESYAWNPKDDSHKPAAHFIQLVAKAAARGGNTLMNVGPMGDGRIDPKDMTILTELGTWWRVNGESIRGTERTTLPVQTWGESTHTGNRYYLHVFSWPTNGRLVVAGANTEVRSAALILATPGAQPEPLRVDRTSPDEVVITVPAPAPFAADSVVVMECGRPIEPGARRLLQPEYPREILRAFDGERHGKLEFGPGKKTDDVAREWKHRDDAVTWAVRLATPATYEVFANYDATKEAGGRFAVTFGTQRLEGVVENGTQKVASLGRVSLPAGEFEIRVSAVEITGAELFSLRHLELRPIAGK